MRRAWLAGVLIVTLALSARLWWGESLDFPRALMALRGFGGSLWAPVTYCLAYFLGTMIFLPAVGFHALAGVTWGFAKGALLAWLALNVGSNLQFGMGRWAGQRAVRDWVRRRGYSSLLDRIEGEGAWTMLWVRQLPLPFFIVNLAAGASTMKWRHFVLGSGLGALPSLIVSTYFAVQILEGVEGEKAQVLLKSAAIGAALLVVVLGFRWWARRKIAPPPP